ncbi:MAG: threonine--tRNA ligase [Thermoplasmata archaeon]|nr:threonine--tRNA ligase [Thermoplasmata archaeon]MBE3139127.1 threonine--tRNA ligase [Thermoplasmata archaeon]
MKLLLIHSDFIEYEVKEKAIPHPEEVKTTKDRLDEALTVFIAVEKVDEKSPTQAVEEAAKEIIKTAEQLKVKNIMLYPYAHLSSDLASAKAGKDILVLLEQEVKKQKFTVKRSPFGWYKAFTISCKGHPLSELSREIIPGKEKKAVEKEREIISQWCILTPNGELIDADKFNFSGHDELKLLYEYESSGTRKVVGEPPHVKMMQSQELVDYEPASDSGNFRWYPKGRMIKGLLEQHINNMVRDIGGMQVETPIMYDLEHPALSEYVKKFPARQYIVKSDKDFFLRFAACFGQYMIAHDMTISYRNLPLRLYELTHYSFRREQSGEVSGLKRLRAFTMPDLHTFCQDLPQATEEFKRQFSTAMQWMNSLNLDSEVALRFVKEFYEKNKILAQDLAKLAGKPILIELWNERYYYFVMKFEFNVIDSMKKASALSTVQIDVENGKRFNITYADEKGEKQHPLILHTSISGSIDRNVYALLEREAIKINQGKKPMLPLWLSPTQIRFIPVADEFVSDCEKFIDELNKISPFYFIRSDIDDREESVGRKIRDAEKEWIPYIVVVGEKERKEKTVFPRVRTSDLGQGDKPYTISQLHSLVLERVKDFPQQKLPLALYLSKRPKFKG